MDRDGSSPEFRVWEFVIHEQPSTPNNVQQKTTATTSTKRWKMAKTTSTTETATATATRALPGHVQSLIVQWATDVSACQMQTEMSKKRRKQERSG